MSGGSWNYMHQLKYGINDQDGRLSLIPDMAKRLRGLGFEETAKDTEKAQQKLDEFAEIVNQLADIWQAVEWYDSHDWGIEQVKREYDIYMAIRQGN